MRTIYRVTVTKWVALSQKVATRLPIMIVSAYSLIHNGNWHGKKQQKEHHRNITLERSSRSEQLNNWVATNCTKSWTGRGRSVGSHKSMWPRIRHMLLWKNIPSSTDSKRASCQLSAKEWTLYTGKLPLGGLPRNNVVLKDHPVMTSAVYFGHKASNQTKPCKKKAFDFWNILNKD